MASNQSLNWFDDTFGSVVQNSGALKDIRAQNVTTHRYFLNLPRRKVMIYYCQKGQRDWGQPISFWREHAPKNTLNLASKNDHRSKFPTEAAGKKKPDKNQVKKKSCAGEDEIKE